MSNHRYHGIMSHPDRLWGRGRLSRWRARPGRFRWRGRIYGAWRLFRHRTRTLGRRSPDVGSGELVRPDSGVLAGGEVVSAPLRPRRHRRYRILGMLLALVLVGEGLYLVLAQSDWTVLVAGAGFLLISAVMIATDRPDRPERRGRDAE